MEIFDTKIIKRTFEKVTDVVAATMGARGRLIAIKQEMDKPLLTDDGVTVARAMLNLKGMEQHITRSMVEAASNTEKLAFDGTTLTIMMINELYKQGLTWIKAGEHPQSAADLIQDYIKCARKILKEYYTIPLEEKQVRDLATLITKVPELGLLVEEAYKKSGSDMRIVIEHTRTKPTGVETADGFVIESGYMLDAMRKRCNSNAKTIYKDAHTVLLYEGFTSMGQIKNFFNSIPATKLKDPFVFFLPKDFSPEGMQIMMDFLIANQFNYQLVFVNDEAAEEIYEDIAAVTNGQVQNSLYDTVDYTFDMCGLTTQIDIERNRSIIQGTGSVDARIKRYQDQLNEDKFKLSVAQIATINRRISALQSGLIRILLNIPTTTGFHTWRMKLDDALGAIRNSFETGVILGGGKALENVATHVPQIEKVLQAPANQIALNAGLKPRKSKDPNEGLNVRTNKLENLLEAGIIDSWKSVDTALANAADIASSYLRVYKIIGRL